MLEVSGAAAPGKNMLVPLCWTSRKSTEGCEAPGGDRRQWLHKMSSAHQPQFRSCKPADLVWASSSSRAGENAFVLLLMDGTDLSPTWCCQGQVLIWPEVGDTVGFWNRTGSCSLDFRSPGHQAGAWQGSSRHGSLHRTSQSVVHGPENCTSPGEVLILPPPPQFLGCGAHLCAGHHGPWAALTSFFKMCLPRSPSHPPQTVSPPTQRPEVPPTPQTLGAWRATGSLWPKRVR